MLLDAKMFLWMVLIKIEKNIYDFYFNLFVEHQAMIQPQLKYNTTQILAVELYN